VKVVAKTLDWVRGQTSQSENDVAKSMTQIANSCNTGAPLPEPAPSSTPQ
jgi:hypothetical protein